MRGLSYTTDDCTGLGTAYIITTSSCVPQNNYGIQLWMKTICPPSLYCGQSTTYYADSSCTNLCKNTGTDCGGNLFSSNPTSSAGSIGDCYKTRSNKIGSILPVIDPFFAWKEHVYYVVLYLWESFLFSSYACRGVAIQRGRWDSAFLHLTIAKEQAANIEFQLMFAQQAAAALQVIGSLSNTTTNQHHFQAALAYISLCVFALQPSQFCLWHRLEFFSVVELIARARTGALCAEIHGRASNLSSMCFLSCFFCLRRFKMRSLIRLGCQQINVFECLSIRQQRQAESRKQKA